MTRQHIIIITLLIILLVSPVHAANDGIIQSITVSGGANPGDAITVSVTIRATSRVNNSNVTTEIIAPSGVVVDSNTYSPPRMSGGDTISYSWTSNNSSYPDIGNYTVQACWSPGNSPNCSIGNASTAFHSADSLGPLLLVGLAIIGWLTLRMYRVEVARK